MHRVIRIRLAACVVAATMCAVSCGRSTEAHADPKTVKACLLSGGAKLLPTTKRSANEYREVETSIAWEIDRSRDGNLIYAINIYVAKDSHDAVKLAKRLHDLASSAGTTEEEIHRASGRRGNVAWLTGFGHHPNRQQRALLDRCIPD